MDNDIECMMKMLNRYTIKAPAKEELMFCKKENESFNKHLNKLEQDNKYRTLNADDSKRSFTDLLGKGGDCGSELLNSSLERIELLENELSESHTKHQAEINKVREMYEERIDKMQAEFQQMEQNLDGIIKTTQQSLAAKKQELDDILETQNKTIEIVKILEQDINKLQEKQLQIVNAKTSMEATLESREKIISDLKCQAYNSKLQVAEACSVVKQALVEKDAALLREGKAQEEIIKLMRTIGEIVHDSKVTATASDSEDYEESESESDK